ncbi:hypothetical protein EMPS_00999 [Entomortierella parvispora]|uniref:FAD-binding domain-containing protein n=1 Tax=Entomortierella parvispora TaxID=205924 RepID=A0A9P3H2Q4_9FUNG|nr:hypothetical protein EMPS_00999 [Entomortierella parvispora]
MNPHRVRKPVDEFDDASLKYPSQLPPKSDGRTPHVMIVGAGLAGLFLAILLDKAGIPYEIYERAPAVRPLGSIMSLNANILACIEQIGLLDELKDISFRDSQANIMYDDMKVVASFPSLNLNNDIGYNFQLFSRPKLHNLLLSKVPAEKIHYNKKVLSTIQNKEGVMIRCADGTTYHGDILVGADGAYSGVRQGLYKNLQDENKLPPIDAKDLSKGFICMVGTTSPLDPEKFPIVQKDDCVFTQVIGKGTRYTWSEFNIPEKRICWVVVYQLESLEESETLRFRNSEWGPESNRELVAQVKGFKVPGGGTLGNLIDATPAENISRVFLEDKLFETWHHGRTVLIGDACHKLLPSAGQGAVCALQDAVILANCLYDLESLSPQHIHEALQDYKDQRYSAVKEVFERSKFNAIFLHGQTLSERFIRYVAMNLVPQSVKMKNLRKGSAYRPQANFLPLAPKRGTCEVLPQKPSKRYEREQKQKQEEALKGQASEGTSIAGVLAASAV